MGKYYAEVIESGAAQLARTPKEIKASEFTYQIPRLILSNNLHMQISAGAA